jgi:hypothetical protein
VVSIWSMLSNSRTTSQVKSLTQRTTACCR